MDLINTLEEYQNPSSSHVLTIGIYDSMHLAHQAIMKRLNEEGKRLQAKKVVITFKNHPTEVLKPEYTSPWICTLPHRVKLLKEQHIDTAVLLTFTKSFSQLSPRAFLSKVQASIPFSKLILGYDAVLGRDREGDPATIQALGKELGFEVEYLPKIALEGHAISSTAVRMAIQKGDFSTVKKLLGRPYSIYAPVITGQGKGKRIGFATANISLEGLCLPPFGVYAVQVKMNDTLLNGVANLGIAPTIRSDNVPILEIHFLDYEKDIYGQLVEVFPIAYIRPEKKFPSIEDLRTQIALDIQFAKNVLM